MTQWPADTFRPGIARSDDAARDSTGAISHRPTNGSRPPSIHLPRPSASDSRECAGSWTDHLGTAHLREVGIGLTFCGAKVDLVVAVRATSGCESCVAESFTDYARHHECGPTCRVSPDEETTAGGLTLGMPQPSEEVRTERNMCWSGQISTPSQACRDVELMQRVREGLYHL